MKNQRLLFTKWEMRSAATLNECLENGVQSNFTTSIAKAFLRLTLFFGFLFFFFKILPTFQPLKFFF